MMGTVERCKAVVIGSGAGGAPVASRLAEAWGDGVVLLEAGPNLQASDFNQIEREMIPKLYAQRGMQATEDGSVAVLQASCVGGTTVVNDALCLRPPPELEERWRALGAEVSLKALAPYVEQVEQELGVEQVPRAMTNRANYLVGLGAARLGWKGERMHHNAPGCPECGLRHLGCSYDAKRSMNVSYVPRAVRAGARLKSMTKAERLVPRGDGWRVECGDLVLEADHVVVAAGVVQTPMLLLRSGIHAGEGFQMHLQTLAWGDFAEPVDGFNGIPMVYSVLEFSDVYGHTGPGFMIEGVSTQPLAFSTQPQGQGEVHAEVLRRYRHLAGAMMVLRASTRGTIALGPEGRPRIDYPLQPHDIERVLPFYQRAVEMFLAAGASRVLLPHREANFVTRPPADLRIGPGWTYFYTAHPFGGACRGGPTVDGVGQVRGQRNLWVLDASAFPEAPGVNPQTIICSLALEGAERLLAAAA
ncbi:MAG: GMC family oxidoreductase [Deltaproteobacteria bacterium]|nr:GMC family oxidoreductase [Deltaproteobacteria bacterium]